MKKLIAFAFFGLVIAGCGEKIYTVDEYKNDDDRREKMLKECSNGERKYDDQNCINAQDANERIMPESFK